MSNGNDADNATGNDTGSSDSEQTQGITDEQLPEDLQPTDDNPLAQNTEDSEFGGDPDEDDEEDDQG